MPHFLTAKRLASALTLSAALLLGTQAQAQAPEKLAPADTAVYIHIDAPADWLGDLTEGPLGQKWRDKVESAEGSGDLLAALGMNVNQFMDAYFGGDVVILSPGGEDDQGAIFTKVAQGDRERAIDTLQLKRNGEIAGNPVYIGPDGDGYFVMMDDWVAFCDGNSVDYLRNVIEQGPNAPRLADTELYAKWTRELPADRSLTALVFENEDSQHAMGVVRKGKSLDATYLGTSPDFDELMGMLGETSVAEFGPLPANTIAAVSFNLLASDETKEGLQGLDMLLRGKSFTNDVLPKLDAPTLLFMGGVDGDQVDPQLSVDVPVIGLALKMNDDSVAADLKNVLDGVVMLSNFAVAEFQAGPVPQRSVTYKDSTFQVAELGKPIAKGIDIPEIAPIQIVYGQVGDYYIVCTQEEFFKQCVDANDADQTMRIEVEGPAHRLANTPVLAMTARPDAFGELLLTWANMLEEKGLPDVVGGDIDTPVNTETLFDVITMFRQYSLMKVQIWSGEGGLVIGRAQLTAPQ